MWQLAIAQQGKEKPARLRRKQQRAAVGLREAERDDVVGALGRICTQICCEGSMVRMGLGGADHGWKVDGQTVATRFEECLCDNWRRCRCGSGAMLSHRSSGVYLTCLVSRSPLRSEEHTSELPPPMRNPIATFIL